jgi:D-alanyl-D-alanine dipeptidase
MPLAPFILTIWLWSLSIYSLPHGFVYLEDIDPSIIQEIRYATAYNFLGRPVKGYIKARCILTQEAAQALAQIQNALKSHGLGLKIYDAYRPQTAVNDFIEWSRNTNDQIMKAAYYPYVNKTDLFPDYIATRSGHSRGSTVDVTLVHFEGGDKNPVEVNMGTSWDYLDPASHTLSPTISAPIRSNRLLLRNHMVRGGFRPIETEWWHFTLIHEPFAQIYFDFPVR